ncbi:MAG: MarR family winged helix-turn-helix transcriptional regulator, partial [Oscillospiraceae bacterium]
IKEHIQKMLESDDVTPSMYINDLSKIFNTTVSRATERMDISHGYRRMLFHLAHNDGVTQLELVKLTHLTPPTVSVSLSKMEKDGLVKRVADEKDMRQVRVYLTEKGREHDNFVRMKCRETEQVMLQGVTETEQEELCRIMRKMLKNLWDNS